jgi:hypothetical protein
MPVVAAPSVVAPRAPPALVESLVLLPPAPVATVLVAAVVPPPTLDVAGPVVLAFDGVPVVVGPAPPVPVLPMVPVVMVLAAAVSPVSCAGSLSLH